MEIDLSHVGLLSDVKIIINNIHGKEEEYEIIIDKPYKIIIEEIN